MTVNVTPDAWWELAELVLAGCPTEALKAYRRTLVIGKGKRLTAKQADAAIKGATCALAGKHREDDRGWLARQVWYVRNKYPVILAQPWEGAHPKRESQFVLMPSSHVVLTWDNGGVDRQWQAEESQIRSTRESSEGSIP